MSRRERRRLSVLALPVVATVLGTAVVPCAAAGSPVTERVNVASDGSQSSDASAASPSISADGRYVAFASTASDLAPSDANGSWDVFVRDRRMGVTEGVSILVPGITGGEDPSLSADGRVVTFGVLTAGANLDVSVRDRLTGATRMLTAGTAGFKDRSGFPSISADGRVAAFSSLSRTLVPGDGNGAMDVFTRDLETGATERVSVGPGGVEGNGGATLPSISADGRRVAFISFAANLVEGDTNGSPDVFVHDRRAHTTARVSVGAGGLQADQGSGSPSISADGRFVAFASDASNLVPGDGNGFADIFVRDIARGTTERVSVGIGGAQPDGSSSVSSISADGRFVAFESSAGNLVAGDTNPGTEVFVHDRWTRTTQRVSVTDDGTQADGESREPSITADGRYVAFTSFASDLVPGDTNGRWDVFVRGPLSFALTRTCRPAGSSLVAFGQAVSAFSQGRTKAGRVIEPERSDPRRALGRPQLDRSYNAVALGFGGSLEICFQRDVVLPPDARLRVWQTTPTGLTFARYPERALIEVSSDGVAYTPTGITSSAFNESYRLPPGLRMLRFVRVTDRSDPDRFEAGSNNGFDVNAVVVQTREGTRLAP